jgi:hypothetical protein
VTTSSFDQPTANQLATIEGRLGDPFAVHTDTVSLLSEVHRLRALLAFVLDGLNTAVLACFPHDEPISFLLTERATCALACDGTRDD